MEFFRFKKDIPFMRHALAFNIISLLTFLLSVFFLFYNGLHLSVEFTGGTLIEVSYSQAAPLEKIREGLLKAGTERSFEMAQIGRVVLGNAAAVEVQKSGSTVDMTPYKRANVARFAVSSDGSLMPVAD